MKKSDIYRYAMIAVVDHAGFHASTKIEIIEMLMGDKSMAEWVEKNEEEQKNG